LYGSIARETSRRESPARARPIERAAAALADHLRPRAFAAPLPAAARGEREWADLWLRERVAGWELRTALGERLPPAHAWVDAEDIWIGAPALAGQVAAADWRIELDPPAVGAVDALEAAAAELTTARTIPRVRVKSGSEKAYDLRPLLADVRLGTAGAVVVVLARTRFDPELGAGRPEEVVAALADAAGLPLPIAAMTRTRLLLPDDVAAARGR
jgi:uncharacterized protein DUF2344